MRLALKRLINGTLGLAGLELRRKQRPLSLSQALVRARKASVRTIIDVGASDGRWSEEVMNWFPNAAYLLIEAQKAPHETALREVCQRHANAQYVLAAAGSRQGTIHFNADDPFGGAASETPSVKNDIEVPMTTIDFEVEQRRLQPPFLIKLDTHGFEVPILQGAAKSLADTNVLIVEVYNFKLCDGCLRFHEMCAHLEERGFRCGDIFDVSHRPKDDVLWQMDAVFLRASRPEFACNSYL
jgi:FkbM family methyltransferase